MAEIPGRSDPGEGAQLDLRHERRPPQCVLARMHEEATMTDDSKGRKRPRDPNQLAKLIVDIASGAVEDAILRPRKRGRTPLR